MRKRHRTVFGVVALPVLLYATQSRAAVVQFTFEGTVTEVTGTSVLPEFTDVQVGQSVTVQYEFDIETPDLSPSPNIGRYDILTYTFSIDTVTIPIPLPTVTVHDGPFTDSYFAGGEAFLSRGGDPLLQRGELSLFDAPNATFADDSLPATLAFDAFDPRQFSYREIDAFRGAYHIGTTLTTFQSRVIPTPAASLFIVSGLGIRRRRRR